MKDKKQLQRSDSSDHVVAALIFRGSAVPSKQSFFVQIP